MLNKQRSLKVFLCHASQDKGVVRELAQRLFAEGWIDPWLDEKKLLPGQDWRLKIEEAVETSDIVIICLSSNSVSKEGYVQKELRYAREIALEKPDETIFLIPLRLDNCETPRGLRFYQWADYFGERKDEAFSALLKSMRMRYEQKIKVEEAYTLQEREKKQRAVAKAAAREKAEREVAERDARMKAEFEAAEKEARAATERVARLRAEHEAAEKVKRKKEEAEPAERVARKEKTEKKLGRQPENVQSKKPKRETAGNIPRENSERRSVQKSTAPGKSTNGIVISITLLVTLGSVCLASFYIISTQLALQSYSTPTQSIAFTATSLRKTRTVTPSATASPAQPRIPAIILTATEYTGPLPTEINDGFGVEMVLVPAGEFTMGSDSDPNDTRPAHQVYLDAFYIDKFEVTNALYRMCVDAGTCLLPLDGGMGDYRNSQYDDFPIVWINWDRAKTFCEWREAELPTEAQWEKAARGKDGSTFPWGESFYCNYANARDYDFCEYSEEPFLTSVGSFNNDKSDYDAYDMAGNVMEFVADWYSDSYYLSSPSTNPSGPPSGVQRVVRGGHYNGFYLLHRSSYLPSYERSAVNLSDVNDFIGFRCARDASR